MDSTTRYLIIALLVVIFLVLSPLILLYVTGRTLPFFDPAPTNTGIIDVQSIPNNATVYLDDEEVGSTPATVRFVKQGQHNVRVTAEGYRDWHKQLFIQSGEVTYAGSINDAIRLLPDSQPQEISGEVNAMIGSGNRIIFIKQLEAYIYDTNSKKLISQGTLNQNISELKTTSRRELLFAKNQNSEWLLLNTDTWQLTNLPGQLATAENLTLLDNNQVAGLVNKNLLLGTVDSPTIKTLLGDVAGFLVRDNLFYIAVISAESNELATYAWDGNTLIKQLVILPDGLPRGQKLNFYLTNQKELFMLAGESFYRVNQKLELLNNSVIVVELEPSAQRLTFITRTEIYFYNFTSNRIELLVRSTEQINSANVLPLFGYGIIAGQNKVEAIEIDSRGNQNRYTLFSGPAAQISIAENEETITVLSDKKLYTVLIQQ